jgi:hypothetical protein
MPKRRRFLMRPVSSLVCLIVAAAASGCITAHYQYTVVVPGADAASPATVHVEWHGGSKDFSVPQEGSTGVTETLQIPGSVFIDIPRGLYVRVTRDGYQTWEHNYVWADEDFFARGWDSFERRDIIELQPVASTQPSATIGGTPLYP